jgi:hypothetical protein
MWTKRSNDTHMVKRLSIRTEPETLMLANLRFTKHRMDTQKNVQLSPKGREQMVGEGVDGGLHSMAELHAARPRAQRFPFSGHLLLLLGLFVVEAIIFFWTVRTRVTANFPIGFDPLSYCAYTYDLIARTMSGGWTVVLDEFINPRQANGISFPVQAALLGLLFGANRTVLLSLNLIYLLATQVVLFQAVRTHTRNVESAWIAVALFMGCMTVFRQGGIYYFMIDFSAMCLYGILACLIVWSKTFLETRRIWLIVVIAAHLIIMRFFVVLYFAGIMFGLLLFAGLSLRSPFPARRAIAKKRIRNIVIAGSLTALLVLPLLFLARETIYNYYVIGHVIGVEKYIRADQFGLHGLLDHVLYYPNSLSEHVGRLVFIAAAILSATALISAYRFDHAWPHRLSVQLHRECAEYFALGLMIFVPIVVLTLNFHKSPLVGAIVIIPLILVFTLSLDAIGRHAAPPLRKDVEARWPWFQRLTSSPPVEAIWTAGSKHSAKAIITTFATVALLTTFATRGLSYKDPTSQSDYAAITQLNTAIGRYVIDNKLLRPTFSIDRVVGYLNWGTLQVGNFEVLRTWIVVDPRFGTANYGIFATPREVALQLIKDSDIVVLTDPVQGRSSTLPIDRKIIEYWDELDAWTRRNRGLLTSANVYGVPHRVYVRHFDETTSTTHK